MKALLFVATVALGFLTFGEAHAQSSSHCIATSGTSGQNTCGHMVDVSFRFANGTYGGNFLRPGESMNFTDASGRLVQLVAVCRARQSGGGGTAYSGGRPVGCN